MKTSLILFGFLFFLSTPIYSQQAKEIRIENSEEEDEEEEFSPWRVAVLIGHTLVPAGGNNSENVAIPSWGLDLEYWPSRRWGVGIHSDVEIQSFIVEDGEGELLEREFPFVLTADLLYKAWEGLVITLGPGVELEGEEDFFLFRFGLEYEFELPDEWDISPTVFYDSRQDGFDTWSIALGVGKRF